MQPFTNSAFGQRFRWTHKEVRRCCGKESIHSRQRRRDVFSGEPTFPPCSFIGGRSKGGYVSNWLQALRCQVRLLRRETGEGFCVLVIQKEEVGEVIKIL